ncbi:hypothetical protein ES703_78980 [subsurface metagenome]
MSAHAALSEIPADCAVCKSNIAAFVAEYAAAVSGVPPIVADVINPVTHAVVHIIVQRQVPLPAFPEVAINHIVYIETKRVNIPRRIFRCAAHAPVASIVGVTFEGSYFAGLVAALAAVAALGVIVNDLAVYKCRTAVGAAVYCAAPCPAGPSASTSVLSFSSVLTGSAIVANHQIVSYYTVLDNGAAAGINQNCGTFATYAIVAVRMAGVPVAVQSSTIDSTAVLNREAVENGIGVGMRPKYDAGVIPTFTELILVVSINNCCYDTAGVVRMLGPDSNRFIYINHPTKTTVINAGINHNRIAVSGVRNCILDGGVIAPSATNGNYKSLRLFELDGNSSVGIHNNATGFGGGRIVIGSAPGLNPPAGVRSRGKCYCRTGVIRAGFRFNGALAANDTCG